MRGALVEPGEGGEDFRVGVEGRLPGGALAGEAVAEGGEAGVHPGGEFFDVGAYQRIGVFARERGEAGCEGFVEVLTEGVERGLGEAFCFFLGRDFGGEFLARKTAFPSAGGCARQSRTARGRWRQ